VRQLGATGLGNVQLTWVGPKRNINQRA